jgi:ubiquitin carboxyl-terminal hydrolase L5
MPTSSRKPVFGLVFLFKYVKDDWDVEEESDTGDVWFANQVSLKNTPLPTSIILLFSCLTWKTRQTVDNACATVAMINILMNAPAVELGEELRQFKEATQCMGSARRGKTLAENQFMRTVHNSFTR